MEIYRVSFISEGDIDVDNYSSVENYIYSTVKYLVETKSNIEFYVGRESNFDNLAFSVIKRVQKELGNSNSSLILVIPYPVAETEAYEKYYDEVIYPSELYNLNCNEAITKCEEWLINKCDLLVANIVYRKDGAGYYVKKGIELEIRVICVDTPKGCIIC